MTTPANNAGCVHSPCICAPVLVGSGILVGGVAAVAVTGVASIGGMVFGAVYHVLDNLSELIPGHPLEFSKIVRVVVAAIAAFVAALAVASLGGYEIVLVSAAFTAALAIAFSNLFAQLVSSGMGLLRL